MDRDESRSKAWLVSHVLGWLAGILFAAALVCGVLGVINRNEPAKKAHTLSRSFPV